MTRHDTTSTRITRKRSMRHLVIFRRFVVMCSLFSLCLFGARQTNAQEPPTETSSIAGITGHYRVGGWTAIQLDDSDASIETLDGDGVRVIYEQPAGVGQPRFGYAIVGSESAPLIVRDADDQVSVSTRFATLGSPSKGASLIPLGMPWIVSVGDPLGVDQIGANKLLDREAQIAVSKPEANEFPDSAIGYDGVDLIMITGAGCEKLRALNDRQRVAIVDWVQRGGRMLVTLGASTTKMAEAAPWLLDMLPTDSESSASNSSSSNAQPELSRMDPSAIETYTSTQSPLSEFSGMRLPKELGKVLIMGRTTRRVSTPLSVEYVVGLGRVTVVAADLDSEPFVDWPDRLGLVKQLTGNVLSIGDASLGAVRRSTAYDDLAGQTRGTLDQFSVSRRFGFSVLALILMGLIALIGPLDYLLINRVFGKPLLGWLTFPIVAVGLSAVLASQATPVPTIDRDSNASKTQSKSEVAGPDDLLRCNRLEIVDIDTIEKLGRGFSWDYIFSHHANEFSVSVDASERLDALASEISEIRTAPFGNPGPSFGGIQISGEDSTLGVFRVAVGQDGSKSHAGIDGLALAPRSSKSLATWLSFTPDLGNVSPMEKARGSDDLQGELVNPLDVDLLNGMLIYRNLVFMLPTRFPAGGKISNIQRVRQKNFRWQLSRQEALEKNATRTESWEPADFGSLTRVAEMLMFHNAVGGTRYTSLKHNPLSFLDLSHLLADDRCMLVGRLKQPMMEVQLTESQSTDKTPKMPSGNVVPMVRLILPVIEVARRRR